MTDDEIWALRRGGLDYRKVYAAYRAATETEALPTVILAKTIKGWQLGPRHPGGEHHPPGEEAHRQPGEGIAGHPRARATRSPTRRCEDGALPYYRPPVDSPEDQYLIQRRKALDGPLPSRVVSIRRPLAPPPDEAFAEFAAG